MRRNLFIEVCSCSSDFMNEISGPAADIMIDAANIFSKQAKGDKLGANEDKQESKQGKDAFGRPQGAVDNP